MLRSIFLPLLLLILACGAGACSTYYEDNIELERRLREGDIRAARDFVIQSEEARSDKNYILYLLNRGSVEWMLGDYDSSFVMFERANRLIESRRTTLGQEILSYLVNPGVLPYRTEDHESVLVHYYQALNFLMQNRLDEALVEARRINIKLNEINDQYESENRYKRDAFALTLTGLIYDAAGDYNNAFIAYRNAWETYRDEYGELFNLHAPTQLKHDLIRAAERTGFRQEAERYRREFNISTSPAADSLGEVVFFWNNGLGPVKNQFAVNFVSVAGEGGALIFQSDYRGYSFPFYPDRERVKQDDKNALEKLETFRVAFPTYTERPLVYRRAALIGRDTTKLELAEDINAIAHQSLEDRMLREFGTALLRVAIKKAAEYGVKQKNETLGALLGLAGALTENADTRNWQVLPHSIYYARLMLPPGEQTIRFVAQTARGERYEEEFTFNIRSGTTQFHAFHTLASGRPEEYEWYEARPGPRGR